MQAAYILVPASCMSTSRGILPGYLGLRWRNFWESREFIVAVTLTQKLRVNI